MQISDLDECSLVKGKLQIVDITRAQEKAAEQGMADRAGRVEQVTGSVKCKQVLE